MIKKLNAAVSFICCLSLMGHFCTMTYSMLTGWYNFALCKNLAHITAISVSVHVFLVMIMVFFMHERSDFSRYKKENARVIIQRISAILIILLIHLHVKNYGFIINGGFTEMIDRVKIVIPEFIFFASVFSHSATSVSRAFVSLGIISKEKTLHNTDIAVKSLSALCFAVVAFTMIRFVMTFGG